MADCANCEDKKCRHGADCYSVADRARELVETQPCLSEYHKAATAIEGRHYLKKNRLQEIILFAKELELDTLGVAFCIGLSQEARTLVEILREDFTVHSVCCKAGGIRKGEYELESISGSSEEVMCNPFGQAEILNREGCQLNIICGLCVGHEAVFTKLSKAPIVTLITKDRVTGHNPAAALYCPYLRNNLRSDK